MNCDDVQSCFAEINAYCMEQPTGRALLVNTENYDIYQDVKAKLEADQSKKFVYVSECCLDNELPDMDEILTKVTGSDDYVLIGYSQAAMLRSEKYINNMIRVLLEVPVKGHTVVLLDHCAQYAKDHFSVHPDIQKRVVLVDGEKSTMPRIRLTMNSKECIGDKPLESLKRLLAYFEKLTDETMKKKPEVTVITKYSANLFENSLYSVSMCGDIYDELKKKYMEVASATKRTNGTEKQWKYLAELMSDGRTFSGVAEKVFGSAVNLESYIGQIWDEGNEDKCWLLWLVMKVIGTVSNKYTSLVLFECESVSEFEEKIYFKLIDVNSDDSLFHQYYIERKRIIGTLPENFMLIDQYCSKVGVHQRNSVYYLTDITEKEEQTFMQLLETYDYSQDELCDITKVTFPSLLLYLQKYVFNETNMKLPDSDDQFRRIFTEYFEEYKVQKTTNHIHPEFLEKVNKFAVDRPYNKLQARSAIITKLDKKNSKLYFFDALGVEYLAYIQAKCEIYGLISEVAIAHCELPSITSKNKEFLRFFPDDALDIKELDELKHHSQVVNYEQCKQPIHLFKELQIIDIELKKIQSCLKQGYYDKAIIVSDHGASRLAVIHEQVNEKLEMDEKGQHSGRCCPVESDPNIPFASYWDGYSILANYDRFKGSRKANVEVHGGASLEEVIVPIISLTKKPADIDICFVNSVVTIKGKEPANIIVYSTLDLKEPKLIVNDKIYDGEFCEDSKHVKFTMPELKRTKDWLADFYDGSKKLASGMEFHIQKNTQEQELFKKKPF